MPFAGYLLPIQYPTGVIREHNATRTGAGLFDVSHMGEIILTGKGALNSINYLMTNDFSDMLIGKARYSPMCNENGGIEDDLIVYRTGENEYLIVVNASNREKDAAIISSGINSETTFEDASERFAQLAVQGPDAERIVLQLARPKDIPSKFYTCVPQSEIAGIKCIISRTGYTGEDGFELYCAVKDAAKLWDELLKAGNGDLIPCGLGARDTLRLEASMPLYGHEMNDSLTPFESGLGKYVRLDKPEFVGKRALASSTNPYRMRAGFKVTGKGIVREHEKVFAGEKEIGITTSGTFCPYLNGAYAMAIINTEYFNYQGLLAEVRGRKIEIEQTDMPFYKRRK